MILYVNIMLYLEMVALYVVLTTAEVTHQDFELAERSRGAVEEIGRQPALVLITVSDRCA